MKNNRWRKKINKRKFDRNALANINFFGVRPLKINGKTILHIDLDKPFLGT